MQQQTLSVSSTPDIRIEQVGGDLRIAGWERSEIMAKSRGDGLNLVSDNNHVDISSEDNLILYLPRASRILINQVSGDAFLQALGGAVSLGSVGGDLSLNDTQNILTDKVSGDLLLRNVGGAKISQVGGDFTLRSSRDDCAIGVVGGDASVRDVEGAMTIEAVGADLYLRNVSGDINVKAGADATLYIDPRPRRQYHITAGDDLLLRLPPNASVELHLTADSAESIQVDFPNITINRESDSQTIVLGKGEARMFLNAGGDLLVTNRADRWDSAADFGVDMNDSAEWEFPFIGGLPPDFSERVNRRVRVAMARAEAHSRKIEHKVAAAVHRAEAKAHAAEQRSRRWKAHLVAGRPPTQAAPASPEPSITDEERLTILRMLQEKKITPEQAEELLAALEGKGE